MRGSGRYRDSVKLGRVNGTRYGALGLSQLFTTSEGTLALNLQQNLYNENLTLTGVLVTEVSTSTVSHTLSSILPQDGVQAVVVESRGEVVGTNERSVGGAVGSKKEYVSIFLL